jgi:hypothetical protein
LGRLFKKNQTALADRKKQIHSGISYFDVKLRHAAALGHRRIFSTGPEPIQNVFPFFTGSPRRAAWVI